MAKPGNPSAGKGKKKGPTKGTGGNGRRALEGRGPTPKAEDRAWHPAGKRKAAAERYAAAGGKGKPGQRPASQRARNASIAASCRASLRDRASISGCRSAVKAARCER